MLAPSPATVAAVLDVDLAGDRDQIDTRADPEFVRLRTEVARLLRR